MPTHSTPLQNHLLAALPQAAHGRVFPHLELVTLQSGTLLCEAGDILRHAYFPTDCIVSRMHVLESGATAVSAVVGNEGMLGVALFMGGESTSSRAIVQIAGRAYRLSSHRVKEEFNQHLDMRILMLRYTQALITQMAQTAVCNRFHSIEQQLCRLLLFSLDRVDGNRLTMTQEVIAHVLGVRREGITQAAGKLQQMGIIAYARGHILIRDRQRLDALSCECYEVVKKESDRLLGTISTNRLLEATKRSDHRHFAQY